MCSAWWVLKVRTGGTRECSSSEEFPWKHRLNGERLATSHPDTLLNFIETGKGGVGSSCPNMAVVLHFRSDLALAKDSTRSQILASAVQKINHFPCIFSDESYVRATLGIWIEAQ